MGRGKTITEFERGQLQVKAFKAAGLSIRQIAGNIHQSINCVSQCVQRGPDAAPKVSSGRKKKLSDRDERNIVRPGSNKVISTRQITSELQLDVHHVLWHLHLDYRKNEAKAEDHAGACCWKKGICPHGPISGIESFLATKSDSTLMGQIVGLIIGTISPRMSWFSRRDNRGGGGSIMIFWLAFSWDRATPVVFVEENITATRYKNILSTHLTPMVDALDDFYDAGAIFSKTTPELTQPMLHLTG